jgi:putative endonuclease
MHKYYVYILECHDETYYTGITSNIENRFIEHQTCKYPKSYTASRQPVKLKYFTEFKFVFDAIAAEKQIKKWSKLKKEALINGEYEELPNLAKKRF